MNGFLSILMAVLITAFVFSCKPKDEIFTTDSSADLRFSADTVLFDTIFSNEGSITKRFKIYNDDRNAIKVSDIYLDDGVASSYTVYFNGVPQSSLQDFVLFGKDSALILVEVFINPMDSNTPFMVEDEIVFETNGNVQEVKLLAYGRDAIYLYDAAVCDTTWSAGKAIVIMDSVTVSSGCSLTIDKGAHVYFHDDAKLKVEGQLVVNGTADSLVLFTSDNYVNISEDADFGFWKGIEFAGATSTANTISHAIINNAENGILFTSGATIDSVAELTIDHTIVQNMSGHGVLAYRTDLIALNSVFSNCFENTFAGVGGGNYSFTHCTLANYGTGFSRQGRAVRFNDSEDENGSTISGTVQFAFLNSIIYGSYTQELDLTNVTTNFVAASLLRTTSSGYNINGNILNENPRFESSSMLDFRIIDTSPAIDMGNVTFGLADDLDGVTRDASPDMGAFEYQ